MNLEKERVSRLDLPGIQMHEIACFLERPCRPLAALLTRERLEILGADRFGYSSRPFSIGTWSIQPKLQLQALWENAVLNIHCLECNIQGLGDWQRAVLFGFTAQLVPAQEACLARVTAHLKLDRNGPLAILPKTLVHTLADQALGQALGRMELRCQKRLRKKMLSMSSLEPKV